MTREQKIILQCEVGWLRQAYSAVDRVRTDLDPLKEVPGVEVVTWHLRNAQKTLIEQAERLTRIAGGSEEA